MEQFTVGTHDRTDFVDVTGQVQKAASAMSIKKGVVTVFVPHTTAGVTINENADPDVMIDVGNALDKIVPWRANYRHCEGNSAAHVKSSMVGSSVQIPVEDGKLCLGIWQSVYFCEFDGPRTRKVWVT